MRDFHYKLGLQRLSLSPVPMRHTQ